MPKKLGSKKKKQQIMWVPDKNGTQIPFIVTPKVRKAGKKKYDETLNWQIPKWYHKTKKRRDI